MSDEYQTVQSISKLCLSVKNLFSQGSVEKWRRKVVRNGGKKWYIQIDTPTMCPHPHASAISNKPWAMGIRQHQLPSSAFDWLGIRAEIVIDIDINITIAASRLIALHLLVNNNERMGCATLGKSKEQCRGSQSSSQRWMRTAIAWQCRRTNGGE